MQKVGLFLAFVLLTFAVDPEKCVQEKCPSEYNACKKAVFGCASKALNCKNKCGSSDPACFEKCCYDSHDAKLIALYLFKVMQLRVRQGQLLDHRLLEPW